MTRRRRDPGEDEGLLDLPLEPPSGAEAGSPSIRESDPAPSRPEDGGVPENLSLFDADREPDSDFATAYDLPSSSAPGGDPANGEEDLNGETYRTGDPTGEGRITFLDRIVSGGADVVLLAGVVAVILVAMVFLGVTPRLAHWPGLLGFVLSFSFLYVTLPLAFWGQTPGMAWARLQARDVDERPLAFTQTVLRWLAGVLTVAGVGLPALLGLGGRSLGDLLSGSLTHRLEPESSSV